MYNYQPFNRMTSTSAMNYDSDVNLVTKSEGKEFWRFTWDHENRMVSAATRKQTVRYKYDALGRRIQRIAGKGRENTKFIFDGAEIIVDDNNGTLTKCTHFGLTISDSGLCGAGRNRKSAIANRKWRRRPRVR